MVVENGRPAGCTALLDGAAIAIPVVWPGRSKKALFRIVCEDTSSPTGLLFGFVEVFEVGARLSKFLL